MLATRINTRHKNDAYYTPPRICKTVECLLYKWGTGGHVVDAGSGDGRLSQFLLNAPDYELTRIEKHVNEGIVRPEKTINEDFLNGSTLQKADIVISNPPFAHRLPLAFINKALDIAPLAIFVLPSQWGLSRHLSSITSFPKILDFVANGRNNFSGRIINTCCIVFGRNTEFQYSIEYLFWSSTLYKSCCDKIPFVVMPVSVKKQQQILNEDYQENQNNLGQPDVIMIKRNSIAQVGTYACSGSMSYDKMKTAILNQKPMGVSGWFMIQTKTHHTLDEVKLVLNEMREKIDIYAQSSGHVVDMSVQEFVVLAASTLPEVKLLQLERR